MSKSQKFEDILTALEHHIAEADYFYFMDGDVRFNEDVRIVPTKPTSRCDGDDLSAVR